jgi:heterotetrameric sarcosine oxidase delta subunit
MLRISCPVCGTRDYTEFRYGGDASKRRPEDDSVGLRAWHDYVFLFDNVKGIHHEYWQHVVGCRQWLVVERDTASNIVVRAMLARATSEAYRDENK